MNKNWNKVSDQLPPTDYFVLGYHKDWTEKMEMCWHDGVTWRAANDQVLEWPSLHPDDGPPTHWMELPDPPAEEEQPA